MVSQNGLHLPGVTSIQPIHHPGKMATPAIVPAETPRGLQIHTLGGFTKLEQLAGMIAGNISINYGSQGIRDTVVRDAVDLAEAILAECERREIAKEEAEAKE